MSGINHRKCCCPDEMPFPCCNLDIASTLPSTVTVNGLSGIGAGTCVCDTNADPADDSALIHYIGAGTGCNYQTEECSHGAPYPPYTSVGGKNDYHRSITARSAVVEEEEICFWELIIICRATSPSPCGAVTDGGNMWVGYKLTGLSPLGTYTRGSLAGDQLPICGVGPATLTVT